MVNSMIEYIPLGLLVLINLATIIYHAYYVRETNKEKDKLINALMSRTSEQFRDLELTSKVEPIKPPMPLIPEPDLIPEADLSDEEFNKYVGKEAE